MGSDSDLKIMEKGAKLLADFGVEVEVRVISAHRTPEVAREFAEGLEERGTRVVIAGAGGAAHLAGVLAAHTTRPVIGVPIASMSPDGRDALLSTVQMPPGVPVATVGVDNAKNAALLAVQMLALSDEALAIKLKTHRQGQADQVRQKDAAVRSRFGG
jgi:5-(carboxyamino)imidazole ribonucleotide mutase